MYLQWPIHDPRDSKDYSIDWSRWLAPGESIISSSWVAPAGLVISVTTFTNTLTTVWLSGGGQSGVIADIQNTITTNQNRVAVKTVALPLGAN
jgi:hypothetical protein